ncbi:MAG: hypothetical protein D6715_09615 [Calditrichaeota bacterium]|nr:MAG: hypothetical protein D6715_09615 [Calditrichota bacterium]
MKRGIATAVLLLGLLPCLFAQTPYTEFKVGVLDPKATREGFLLGLNVGRSIDESLSWGLEIDYFQRTFRKEEAVRVEEQGQAQVVIKQRKLEFTTRILPIIAKLNWERQLGNRGPFYLRASGGLGWELAWNSERNFVEQVNQTRFFNGFGWQVSGGLGIAISSSGNFFVDLFYNGGQLRRNQQTSPLGLPTWEELDVSGLGLKAGVSIVGFGW